MEDIEIEILPTIGGALSIKNSKNRSRSISEETRDYKTSSMWIGAGKIKQSKDTLILTARNILIHKYATSGQKKIASDFLEIIERDGEFERFKKVILSIARGLNRRS